VYKPAVVVSLFAALLIAGSARAQTYGGDAPVCLHVFGELEGERMDCISPRSPGVRQARRGVRRHV